MDTHASRPTPARTLLILGIGTLGFVLAQTTVIPALGDLQRELGASATGITWMVTAYLLVASIATPILGRLGDMFGKERLLAISLALFAVGSVVCALSDSLGPMIVGRGLQGLGGGVFPLSFGIIRDEFPREKVPTGIAMLGAIAAIGSRRRPPARRACSSTGRATTGSSGSAPSWASWRRSPPCSSSRSRRSARRAASTCPARASSPPA